MVSTMVSNMIDTDPEEKAFHFFITSLISEDFFYDFVFRENNPSNAIQSRIKENWWHSDYLFNSREQRTPFELFKRRMNVGYNRYNERLISVIAILPSNFNFTEKANVISSVYGDKIFILTAHLAKLYYIISKIVNDKKIDFNSEKNLIIIYLHKEFITGELYHIKFRDLQLMKRIQHSEISDINFNSEITEIMETFDANGSSNTIIFTDDNEIDTSEFNCCINNLYVIKKKPDEEMILEGAKFKVQSDFKEEYYNIYDKTKEMPYFNIVYSLLNEASNYHPLTEAFGIDLGTSRSALAVHRFHENADILDVVPDQRDAESLLYSWVAFDISNQICGKCAFERFRTKAKYTVFDCKKIIGKAYEEVLFSNHWKFKIIDNQKGGVEIKVKSKSDYDFFHVNKIVTPEEIYAIMLRRFQSNATYFAKNAMKEAAKLANIEVLRFIPEPTAAALSYCSEMRRQLNDNEKIFVFDLGGGTFDISIFNVNNAKLIELCQHSNLKLGGSNFDNILFNYAKETFLKEHELDLTYKENDLFIKSIIAKEALTESEFTNINFQKYINDNDDEVDVDITREKFQDLSESLLDELKEDVDKALQKAHLNANDITLVIKVGGSCAMPMIRSLIVDIFQNAEVNFGDPQHEVAKGAALYAASILPQKE